ncbi:MAG TPA: glutamate synthase-related protein [Actinomycetota bacterium]
MYSTATERDACGIGFIADAEARASRAMVETAIDALCNVRHRGAVAADAKTGDGAGLLLPIPRRFFAGELSKLGLPPVEPAWLGVGMCFVRDATSDADLERIVEAACLAEAIEVVAWRDVPIDPNALGGRALALMPRIRQAIMLRPVGSTADEAERQCHRARRRAEKLIAREERDVYFPSFSFRTVTYKALVAADQLAGFYRDLDDELFEASFAIFHQRYSTNTAPSWTRAQPFRMLCHNGEINTIDANVIRMRSREGRLGKWSLIEEEVLRPVIDESGSDSAMLDNAIELLTREGPRPGESRDIRHVVAMMIPAAWEQAVDMDPVVRDFYRWHESLMEPWDGPAGLIFTDGIRVGASLDRNGLRPLRTAVCEDGFVAVASEAGAVSLRGHGAVKRGKLGPGEMVFVDPTDGGFQSDPIARIAGQKPYGIWLSEHRADTSAGQPQIEVPDDVQRLQVLHGVTREEIALQIRPASANGKEPTFSMGDDTALAPLAAYRRPLYNYFKQRFAQVTNPAIDHLRERHVMSIRTVLGPRDPVLWERPEGGALLEYDTFLLFKPPGGTYLDATFPVAEGPAGLQRVIEALGDAAVRAAVTGSAILIVSDENVGADRAPVPSLLAVGAVRNALVRAGHRTRSSIVVQTDDARESHHFACLLGYGAEAIYPRLALATVAALAAGGRARDVDSPEQALLNFRSAIEEGVLKIMSKMGISTVDSYRGSQIFDITGLNAEVVSACFAGTPSPVGGIGFERIARDALARHADAYGAERPALANPGFVKFRSDGEYHMTEPNVVRALHNTVDPGLTRLKSTKAGDGEDEGAPAEEAPAGAAPAAETADAHVLQRAITGDPSYELYERFAARVNGREPAALRDLLEPVPAAKPIPLSEVEPATSIATRFSTGAISHGAISAEAHETLAVAMRRIGGKANTGEGGEDPARYRTEKNSAIKQVASGRFGVTPEYCAFADELQIKIAQGSKPGEGGQLPGHKATEEIARLRHTQPGVALISPPPHHDIYSIEDLAQLIYDLKQVNPRADVSVKLVAEVGVGTIAAGVVKGLADVVHISGADGGTGASPLSSIKNAGLPWEIGLAEAQHALVDNGLRDRARLRVDGGFKTGRDVLIAALLGADEYSFGTAALIAEGCIMVRTCHLDTCPVGIATQKPELREKFAGTPEMVAHYMMFVAEEVRQLLASLGLRTLDDAVGRTDLLRQRVTLGTGDALDLSGLLGAPRAQRHFRTKLPMMQPKAELGDRLVEDAFNEIRHGATVELDYAITTADRSFGARLGGGLGYEFGAESPPGRAIVRLTGEAGQSFGAFLAAGVELHLTGEANDYVGKGMGGGLIAISPPANDAGEPYLAGNTVLYGATGGALFVAGRAGERFAVRNSGASAVVEGVGQHACEYMTGGTVVVLGPVGQNLGAGMTGGECYVFDPAKRLRAHLNPGLVEATRPTPEQLGHVHALLQRHHELTGSKLAGEFLREIDFYFQSFWRVAPKEDAAAISQKQEGTVRGAKA